MYVLMNVKKHHIHERDGRVGNITKVINSLWIHSLMSFLVFCVNAIIKFHLFTLFCSRWYGRTKFNNNTKKMKLN